MVVSNSWTIEDQGLTTAPSPSNTDPDLQYLIVETQDAATEWTGQEGKIARWTLGSNWSISSPVEGDFIFDRDTTGYIGAKARYEYDGSSWRRVSNPGILSSVLSTDFTLDGTWQQLTGWSESAAAITAHSWFNNNDGTETNNGMWTAKNRNQRLVEITASIMFGFDSGTQSATCEARLERNTGGGWNAIPSTTHGEGLLNANGLSESSATLACKVTANEGNQFRIAVRRLNGSATCEVLAIGTRIDICEVLGV